MTGAEGAKKAKVEGGIVRTGTNKGDEFTDFSFKEGNTQVLRIQDIFIQEKGKDAAKRDEHTVPAQAKVKGGVKGKRKAVSKSAAREKKVASTKKADTGASKSVDKILKYTPNKSSSRKETPQKSAAVPPTSTAAAKKSTTGGKKQTPALPSPGGKLSTKTVDEMPMAKFKRYIDWHKNLAGGKPAASGKVLGKRSSGKASATSGKASKASKRSKK